MDSILQNYLSAGRNGAQDNLDRASYNNTLQDIFKKKLEADRYRQLTPHEVNIKALEGDRASMMRDPGMLDAYGAGQLGTFQSSMAKGMEDMGTVDSRIDKTNAENNQAKLSSTLTRLSQFADFVDAAVSKGGDQGAMAMLQQVSPELAAMYQKEIVSGKSGKQVVTEFKTKLGQIKDQMMQNASYDPKYYAESRLRAQDNAARIKEAGIQASSRTNSESSANLMYYRTRLGQEANLIKSLQQVLSSGSGLVNGTPITGIKPGTIQYENLQETLADAMDNYNSLAKEIGDNSRYNSSRYRTNRKPTATDSPTLSLPPGAKLKN